MNRFLTFMGYFVVTVCFYHCQQVENTISTEFITPNYDSLKLEQNGDSLHFIFSDSLSSNKVASLYAFADKGREYLVMQDARSGAINFYALPSCELVKQIRPEQYFRNFSAKHLSSFCKNFDSILLRVDRHNIYLMDSSGKIKQTTHLQDISKDEIDFSTNKPLVVKDGLIFAGLDPSCVPIKKEALQQWKIMYGVDMNHSTTERYCHLPKIYREYLYGLHFMDYSYCFNDRNNIVFSFPADPNLYETNFGDTQMVHYGRSRYQHGDITPVRESALDSGEGGREFHTRDAYGTIHFDPYTKRYLRYFRQRVANDSNYAANRHNGKESVIVFGEFLGIIGESTINEDINFRNLFITPSGKIYVQLKNKDKKSLHFVQLTYNNR